MTTPFKHENVIKLAGVLGVAPELRLTANGNAVATLIVYTNYTLRNDDGSRRQESDRQFQGQDADRQAKIEDMRARQAQAAQQVARRQQAMNGGGPTNGGAY